MPSKEEIFLSEPIGDKPSYCLPGIEEEHALNLQAKGFDKAYEIFGQFLLLKQEKFLFVEWLKMFDVDEKSAVECYDCLKNWAKKFM